MLPIDLPTGHPAAQPEALAFDVYGTLVDPIAIQAELRHALPATALRVAEVWRQKQLEYSFRLTVMGRYEDFEALTRKALDYALAATGTTLDDATKAEILARYDDLAPFPDAEPALRRLRDAGLPMVIFSNGSPRMLAAFAERSGLGRYFSELVSVDAVQAFKPAPAAYRHVAERLRRPPSEVRLISSNPFDVIGAEAAGLRAAWIDRSGGVFDTIGSPPDLVVASLAELADRLTAR